MGNPFSNFVDPLGIMDFAKDQYGANRDFGHSREMQDVGNRFTEMMSNTSYQRAVTDMKAAGLNPMLAYQQGGASSPGSASGPAFSRSNSSAGSLHSAAAIEQLRSQTNLNNAQAENVRAQKGGHEATSKRLAYELENLVPTQLQTAALEMQIKETEALVAQLKHDFLEGVAAGDRGKFGGQQERMYKARELLYNHFENEYKAVPAGVRNQMLEATLKELNIEWYLPKLVGNAAKAIGAAGVGGAMGYGAKHLLNKFTGGKLGGALGTGYGGPRGGPAVFRKNRPTRHGPSGYQYTKPLARP